MRASRRSHRALCAPRAWGPGSRNILAARHQQHALAALNCDEWRRQSASLVASTEDVPGSAQLPPWRRMRRTTEPPPHTTASWEPPPVAAALPAKEIVGEKSPAHLPKAVVRAMASPQKAVVSPSPHRTQTPAASVGSAQEDGEVGSVDRGRVAAVAAEAWKATPGPRSSSGMTTTPAFAPTAPRAPHGYWEYPLTKAAKHARLIHLYAKDLSVMQIELQAAQRALGDSDSEFTG